MSARGPELENGKPSEADTDSSPDSTNRHSVNDSLNEKQPDGHADASGEAEAKPEGPPNGGLAAWLQVLGSFTLFFNTWYAPSLETHLELRG